MSVKLNVGKYFKKRTKMPHFVLSVFVTTLKMFLIFTFVLFIAGFGTIIGIATGYMEATPVLDIRQIEEQAEASFIYDRHGKLITTYHGLENRIWASIDEIPAVLENAFIAIEDIRFHSHNGIDLKRIAGSFVNNLLNESLQGGSTITQQLIKNTLLTPERSYKRKIQEAYLAIQLEQKYTKEQILEAYLNTIYLGNGNHGVKTAALDYFGKELADLTLREAAVLAGVPRSTARFNPRRNMYDPERKEILFNRTNTVLYAMYENGLISQEQFEEARFGDDELAGVFSDGFTIIKEPTNLKLYDMPHFIEYVIMDVVEHLMLQNGWKEDAGRYQALEMIHEGGLHIYTTVDTPIQLKAQEVMYAYEDFPEMASSQHDVLRDVQGNEIIQPQAAFVIIDHASGEIRALVGGRTPPKARFWLNRANESWPVGSAIKPISIYAPFIEAGYPGGIILENVPGPIIGWDVRGVWGYPSNFTIGDEQGTYTGPVTARKALARSFNTTAARGVFRITPDFSAQKLKELGITSTLYIEEKHPSNLALGSDGINMVEFTAANAAIANKGIYQKPISFSRVLDRNGNEILKSADFQIKREVFRETTAFILTEWLKDAASPNGTGRRAMFNDMPVAGKTGTNQDLKGVIFTGFTPYYTASVWIGHDRLQSLKGATAGRFAAPLWRSIMEPIHAELDPKPFFAEVPQGIVRMQVCGISGMLPNGTLCDAQLVTEWFPRDAIPRDICTLHHKTALCRYSGKLLTPYCPPEHAMQSSLVILPEGSPLTQLSDEDLVKHIPGAIRGGIAGITDIATLDYYTPAHSNLFCPLHTQQWASAEASRTALAQQALTLINDVKSNINDPIYAIRLSIEDRNSLTEQSAALKESLQQSVLAPPEEGQFLTNIPIFDSTVVQPQINTLRELNYKIFQELDRIISEETVSEAAFPIPSSE